eukprot:554726-Alexandrium_andersonii.AAC.1
MAPSRPTAGTRLCSWSSTRCEPRAGAPAAEPRGWRPRAWCRAECRWRCVTPWPRSGRTSTTTWPRSSEGVWPPALRAPTRRPGSGGAGGRAAT